MYSKVAATVSSSRLPPSPTERANPKSMRVTEEGWPTGPLRKTLSGFTSPWTTLAAWDAARPLASWRISPDAWSADGA
jgi:hypothetical protein